MDNPDKAPFLSAVVCTRNRAGSCVPTIETLLKCQFDDYEIILVDQSTDSLTRKAVEPFLSIPQFRYIQSDTKGVSLSRNIGLKEARGEIVVYTDDDCTVPPNFLMVFWDIFQKNNQVGVAFCNVKAGPHDSNLGFVPAYERHDDKLVSSVWDKCRARGIGAGMAVRKQAVLSIGGYDESLGPGTQFPDCEDGDIAVRSLLSGWPIYETNKTFVVHHGFRGWAEGRELSKRNWVGIGAAYSKPLRCGYWQFVVVVFYEMIIISLLLPLLQVLKLRKPRGLKQIFYFLKGYWEAIKRPLDCQTIKFL